MIEETLEVGPFTPQELETVCEKLKSQGVHFEILKDEAQEKSELKNDYQNVVLKLEFRVETYLGQVFYLRLNQKDFDRNRSLFEEYGMATTHEENPIELNADVTEVEKEASAQKKLQQMTARALMILAFSYFLYLIGNALKQLILDL
jgi:hypothetical protein